MTLACSECITGDDKTCKRCEGQAMTDDIMTRVREWLASCVRVATENGVPEEADLEAAALAFIDGEPARMAAAREEQARADMEAVNDALARGESWTPNLTATPLADEIAALRARVAYLEGELHETIGENADLVVRAERAEAERVAELEKMLVFAGTGQRGAEAVATIERLEKAEARVAELEADLEVGRETCRRHGTTSDTGADAWSASKLIGFLSHNLAGKASAVKDACAVLERYTVERDALRAQLLSERERLERWLTAPDGKQYERGTVQAVFDECDALLAQMEAAREAAERIVKTQWRMPDCYITATAILRAMDEAKP